MDTGLLPCADADGLAAFYVADGVGLGVFQGDQCDLHVDQRRLRYLFVHRDDIGEQIPVHVQLVTALFEGDAVDLLALYRGRDVGGVDLDDIVIAALLGLQKGQGLLGVARGDAAVGHLPLDQPGRVLVADVGQGDEVAEGGHPVSASGPGVGAGQGGERT